MLELLTASYMRVRFFFRSRHALLAVHVHAFGRGGDRHPRVPVIGRRDDHRVHVATLQQVAVVAVSLGGLPGATGSRPRLHRRGGDSTLGSHVEHVAHGRDRDVQVVLAEIGHQGLVARVLPRLLTLLFHPVGMGESGVPDQGLPLPAEPDDADPYPLTGWSRHRVLDERRPSLGHAQLLEDRTLLGVLDRFLLEIAVGEGPNEGD